MAQHKLARHITDKQGIAAATRTDLSREDFRMSPAIRREALIRNLVDDRLIV